MVGFSIDFGTTNSVIAKFDSAASHGIPFTDQRTNRPHPSVVWYRPDSVRVGEEAKKNINTHAEAQGNYFATSIKKRLGKQGRLHVLGESKSYPEVASDILKFLVRQAWEDYDTEVTEAVITVPVYFDGRARRDLRRAAELAGISIKGFIHEPFAAAVGYFHQRWGLQALERLEGRNILVFDWGGGTLDITVAAVDNGVMMELGTSGLSAVAGDLFDQRIVQATKNRVLSRMELSPRDVEWGPGAQDRFLRSAEDCKIALSNSDIEPLDVANALQHGDDRLIDVSEVILRTDFEKLIEQDVADAMVQVDACLKDARLTDEEIDVALMIGGTSDVPLIRDRMLERFGSRLEPIENPRTIIAEGGAIADALGLHSVMARSIGVRLPDGLDYPVFPMGMLLKKEVCQRKINFFCTDNRDGEGKLVLTEEFRGQSRVIDVLAIPVSPDLGKVYKYERVSCEFLLDDDLVLKVAGQGATQPRENRRESEVYKLCFGLATKGAET